MRSGAYVTEVCVVIAPSPSGRNASQPPPAYVGEELQVCGDAAVAGVATPVAAAAPRTTAATAPLTRRERRETMRVGYRPSANGRGAAAPARAGRGDGDTLRPDPTLADRLHLGAQAVELGLQRVALERLVLGEGRRERVELQPVVLEQ